ncbi:MAG: PHP domain-containing protein [Anaerolineae bacterium]
MRLDLHVHTNRSLDCLMTPEVLARTVQARGLDGVAVTDHNDIEGAIALAAIAPFTVIVGEEIKTTEGEVCGLFLRERISPRLSPEETLAAIHEQGGLAYVPHPLDRLRNSAMGRCTLERVLADVDILEVFNARVLVPQDNTAALLLARQHGLAMGAGSDGHIPYEVGRAYVEIQPFADAAGFLQALRQGHAAGRLSSPLVHLATSGTKRYRRLAYKLGCRQEVGGGYEDRSAQ